MLWLPAQWAPQNISTSCGTCCAVCVNVAVSCSYPTFKIEDPDEQLKARQALLVGELADKLLKLSKLLVSSAHRP
jgi:hypothetical protein